MSDLQNYTPLQKTVNGKKTDLWNDSCSVTELAYAIENGAVGATTNPVIVVDVLKKEMHLWRDRINDMLKEMPFSTEDEITWKLIEEMAVKGADILRPIYEKEMGLKGRISIQTNAKYYRDAKRMVEQAVHFNNLAPNMQIKIPVTKAGVEAIEEATYRGVNINATVCFTVPQTIAVAEAVERGLMRREKEGLPVKDMTPVCTIMVGRTDDWIKQVGKMQGTLINPEYYEWAGIAVCKNAYKIYKQRKYRTRLLFGALRNHHHWSQFIGGDLVLTIQHSWQKLINSCDIAVVDRIDDEIAPEIVHELSRKFPDFIKAYNENGMNINEFDTYGATLRTMRGFLKGYEELVGIVREFMLPNPDAK